ncbi:MFS transporter, DHA2 family, lincomycin resistance protein [Terribacillus halophilus]|uniref:MFS transporter, DHA2 family, lincomycin resistance protein n=1 Tax=Terribacillus halophilus TaxID=361279 RepID=A0A1G6RBX8_9BACI|nr:DHA2 family efflux MFS transporter permease subunit [Terribacillus halophilus]SDD01913.1 MFS transporter, DHA2 family, lincomycin resistance protein [Terribacillus halophilus]
MDSNNTAATAVDTSNIKTMPIIISFLIAGFVGLFSETALNIALQNIINGFGISASSAQWLTTGYLLTLGVLVPVSGLIMQWFTTRQLFLTSLVFSIIGTLIAAIAPSFAVLLIARIVQAVGTALLLPLMFNTILNIIPPHRRGKAMGLIGLVIMFAPAVGPTVSGLIIDKLTWHWIFWFSLPLLVIALVFGAFFMQNVTQLTKPKIDILSIVLSTIGFGGVVYGFSHAGEGGGWGDPIVIVTIAVGILSLILFSVRQVKMEQPMMNLNAFRYPMFVLGLLLILVSMMVMLSSMILLPLYLQTSLALTPLVAGLTMLPGGVINGLLSPVMGGLFDKFGPRFLVTPGLIIVTLVMFGFSTISLETSTSFIVGLHIALMIGISMIMMPAQTNGLNQLPPSLYPDGTAIMNTLQQVAGAIGTAVAISIMTAGSDRYMESAANPQDPNTAIQAFTEGVQSSFIFGIIAAIVGVVISFFIRRVKVDHQAN